MAAAISRNTVLTGACLGAWLLSIAGGIIAGSTDGAGLFEVIIFAIARNAVGVFAGAALTTGFVFVRWLAGIANPEKTATHEIFSFLRYLAERLTEPRGTDCFVTPPVVQNQDNDAPAVSRDLPVWFFAVVFVGHYVGAIAVGIIGVKLWGMIGAFLGVVLGIALGALVPAIVLLFAFKFLRKVIAFT